MKKKFYISPSSFQYTSKKREKDELKKKEEKKCVLLKKEWNKQTGKKESCLYQRIDVSFIDDYLLHT